MKDKILKFFNVSKINDFLKKDNKIKLFYKKNHKVINITILTIYFVLLLFASFRHEPWLDESQAWILARDLSFVDLIKQMQFEGHPCLWHLILFPFAKLGFPQIVMTILTSIFMVILAYIILEKSPFCYPVKLIIIFSAPFMYFYSLQSRVYTIIPFIMALMALAYKKRNENPYLYALTLAIMANTHIMLIAFVAINSIFFFIENLDKFFNKKSALKYIGVFSIIALGVILCYLQINISLDKSMILHNIAKPNYSANPVINFFLSCYNELFKEFQTATGIAITSQFIRIPIVIVLLLIVFYGFKKSPKQTTIIIVSFGFQFLVCIYIWFAITTRSLMFLFYIIFCAWIKFYDIEDNKEALKKFWHWQLLILVVCGLTIPFGIKNLILDINQSVAGGKPTAEFIKENLDEPKFLTIVDYNIAPITAYFDKNTFFSPIRNEYCTFTKWDNQYMKIIRYNEFLLKIKIFVDSNPNTYLIHSRNYIKAYDDYISQFEKSGYIKEIYMSPNNGMNEMFWIYEFTDKFKSL